MPLLSLMKCITLFFLIVICLNAPGAAGASAAVVAGDYGEVGPLAPAGESTYKYSESPESDLSDPSVMKESSLAQNLVGDSVTIRDIFIRGHKRTRDGVVFREMTFGKEARIAEEDLDEEIALTYAALMNTGLFSSVDITYSDSLFGPGNLQVFIDIRETWYIYPVPVFTLADRNFNVWWRDENHSLDRVNLGAKLSWYNFTGRRDRFKIGYTTGYTRKYEAGYRLPYLNKAKNIGIELDYSFSQRREQNYQTIENQQVFYQDPDRFVYKDTRLNLSFNYRKKLYVTHTLRTGYRSSVIADTIANALNPDFFGEGRNSQRFFQLEYTYVNDKRDVRNYPWKGYYVLGTVVKDGMGITGERNSLTAGLTVRKFWPLSENLSINAGVAGKYSLIRTQQPFLENRAIGFGNNGLVGYQFYVVDGLDMAIWRFGIRQQLFKTDLDLGKLVFIDAFRYIPVRVLLAFQFNQGIANAPYIGESNKLNNTLLTGASLGLDVVLFYDMVGSLQYNRNHLGEGEVLLALNLNF
ncbi:BamA/TamA family outer membrane protein [Neolewinella aurantiaca]|uniref:BamA/TamA family outer membrane protein n=1 Tax=Neolewinella aurantiaca TaxID=2602767 RepID=A0A5C7FD58_9BACT|nr:BamA/TamA family outer membrane protein [Neolewinella aurantiaca]TXF85237.1 BamA/TamA family outer membrane protein [Neolewinella aurantiaca]